MEKGKYVIKIFSSNQTIFVIRTHMVLFRLRLLQYQDFDEVIVKRIFFLQTDVLRRFLFHLTMMYLMIMDNLMLVCIRSPKRYTKDSESTRKLIMLMMKVTRNWINDLN